MASLTRLTRWTRFLADVAPCVTAMRIHLGRVAHPCVLHHRSQQHVALCCIHHHQLPTRTRFPWWAQDSVAELTSLCWCIERRTGGELQLIHPVIEFIQAGRLDGFFQDRHRDVSPSPPTLCARSRCTDGVGLVGGQLATRLYLLFDRGRRRSCFVRTNANESHFSSPSSSIWVTPWYVAYYCTLPPLPTRVALPSTAPAATPADPIRW
jgi:hypothetical protein